MPGGSGSGGGGGDDGGNSDDGGDSDPLIFLHIPREHQAIGDRFARRASRNEHQAIGDRFARKASRDRS
eukprot:5412560-Pleurochrysis_carterae.AAC.1